MYYIIFMIIKVMKVLSTIKYFFFTISYDILYDNK